MNYIKLYESYDSNTIELYHGTSDIYYDDIMSKGLKSPYLTDSLEKAEYYSGCAIDEVGGNELVLVVKANRVNLRVDFNELDEPVTLGDRDMYKRIKKEYKKYAIKYPESVVEDRITINPKDYYVSLEACDAVRHEGDIMPEQITLY